MTMTPKFEFGPLPKPRRGLLRVCPVDVGIEDHALWLYERYKNTGLRLKTAVRMAVARYDIVFDTFRNVRTLDEEDAKVARAVATNMLDCHKRGPYEIPTDMASIDDFPKAPPQDRVVLRVYASVLRRIAGESSR
jgi:hypothetical protein